MHVTLSEKQALIGRYRDKAWAHILMLDRKRGRKLNPNQERCITNTVGEGWQDQ
jgi:hypothetical protein